MRLSRFIASLGLFVAALAAAAQTIPVGYVQVTGTYTGGLTSLEANGTISFAPVNNSGTPIGYRIGQGSGAVVTASWSSSAITGCTVVSGGSGYTNGASAVVSTAYGSGGVLALTVTSGSVTGCAVTAGGSYTAAPSVSVSGYGQATQGAITANVVNGVFSVLVPDTSMTSPVNVCFNVTVVDNVSGNSILGPGYACVQPAGSGTAVNGSQAWCTASTSASGGTCNFDAYPPNLTALVVAQTGPAGPAGATGATGATGPPITFLGAWSNSTAYTVGQAVSYGGSSYVALANNTGVTPVAGATWGLLAQAAAGGTPGGTSGQVQINSGGTFGGVNAIGSGSVPLISSAPTQPGQAPVANPSTQTFSPGFPTAGSVRGTAITQNNFAGFNCATLADVAAQNFCTSLISLLYNAGIAGLNNNQLANKFATYGMWWNMSNASTIANAMGNGTHTLTLGSSGYGAPPMYGGNGYPQEVRFGYAADSYDQHTTTYNSVSNSSSYYYTDATSNSDGSCYQLSLAGRDCTIIVVGRQDNDQWLPSGSQVSVGSAAVQKFFAWAIYPGSQTAGNPVKVAMYNQPTSAQVTATCPAYTTDGAYTEPNQVAHTDYMIFLSYNHTAGSFTCAVNDGAASASTAVTLGNGDASYALIVGNGPAYIQAVAVLPYLLSQQARTQLYNGRFYNKPPLFDTHSYTQLDQYQIQCSDYLDQNFCGTYTNGSEGGGTSGVYQATGTGAHVQFQTNAKRIYFSADPGIATGSSGVAVHVNGALQCYDSAYSSIAQNVFSCDLGNSNNSTVTVDIANGFVGANYAAGYTWTQLNSGYSGLFLNSIYFPKDATFTPPSQITPPATMAMLFVDSIPAGAGATNSSVGTWPIFERYAPGGNSFGVADVAEYGAGSLSLWNNCPTQAACTAWYTAAVAGHISQLTVVVDQRGTNDFLHGCSTGVGEGLANYTLALGYFLTAVQAVTPSAHVYELGEAQLGAQPPTAYDGCSGSTNTVAAYSAAKSSVCSTFSSICTYYDMTNTSNGCPALSNTGDYISDNTHLTEQGARKFALCLKTYLSASNPTSINYLKF